MNVFVTFEENIIISSKTFKKQNVTDRQMEKQFSVPISHVHHLLLMRIYFKVQEYMYIPLYNFVDFTFSYSKQHYS